MRSSKYDFMHHLARGNVQAGVTRFLAAILYISLLAACSGSSGAGAPIAVRPSITVQPVSATVVAGQAASFSVTAAGSLPLSYQWRRNAANIAGATRSSYVTGASTSADSGSAFTVLVSNSLGSVTSAAAILTVHTAPIVPSITTQPANQSVTAGQTASFSVVASGTPPLSYQWQKGGAAIAGAIAPSYTTPATSTSDNGAAFQVTVKNAAGSVSSNVAKLTVIAVSAPHIVTSNLPGGTVRSAYAATLKATEGTPPYTWDVSLGRLPAGLSLDAATGIISGTPTSAGTASFTIKLTDARSESATLATSIAIGDAVTAAPFRHVVIVLEENQNASSVVGNSEMPYLNSLIHDYGLATQYYANTHPSIGNYLMLTTGQVLTNDDNDTPSSFPASANNVVRQLLIAGKSFKAYAENLPFAGYTGGDSGNYAVRHVPLAFLTDVQDSSSEKLNLVPFTQFAADLAAGQLPDYAFVTPNLCDDAHNCALGVADSWLQTHIDPLLKSSPFKNDGLLIIVFDESESDNSHGGGRTPAILVSPAFSKAGYQSTVFYQHESTLRLMLEGLGVKGLPGASATAPTMWEFFTFPSP
jgi:hypothetical protein